MTASFSAAPAGRDLDERVRTLRRVHDAVLAGSRPPVSPRPIVARSWRRVLGMGLASDGGNLRDPLGIDRIEQLRRTSPLRHVIDDVRSVLTAAADASNYIVVVTDQDGTVLWREGSPRVRMTADRLGFAEGATWTEARVGTNAIGTAIAEAAPVELFAGEHFERQQHPWYCSAAPIHDPRTGELIGVVDVSGPAFTLHPAIGALVSSATRLAEAMLWQRHRESLEGLRRASAHLVRTGPALIVDDAGWVAHSVGTTPRERIAAPADGVAVAVPGVGICLPERLSTGWLVRPSGWRARLHATLRGDVLEVHADGDPWHVQLTPRHAQVMRLLAAAGPEGLSASRLSREVFGDADHEVSVRAEVSRLRRVVGALVATRPYRISDGVEVTVEH
ncbi:helix-turn-helix domain-containing protein [Microbacterium sp. No. 7]|uniref:helix-turn-helix domain-containing protein n=1 Tax=Microbacterium sp. No. 7 TaxID=1714373 RepID=UPI0006D199AC|nr:helix-turn-helix domain-containing protein [Microbacterium sp. No. 7]ALJ20787.1 diguanylate cyclase [Microbacterium sp. No. 7]